MTPPDPLWLALLGGLLALDGTAAGQFMVSRPLVAGTLTGWMTGDPMTGLLLGGILEVYFISVFPVGGAEFPEGGPPAVVGVATAVAFSGTGGFALGALVAFFWSRLGAASIRWLRKLNGRILPSSGGGTVGRRRVACGHLACVGLDFSRGFLITLLGLLAAHELSRLTAHGWPLGMPTTLGLLAVGATLPAGAFLASLGGWRRRGLSFGLGLACALIGGWIL